MRSYEGFGKDCWLFWAASSLSMGASDILQYVPWLYVLDLTGSATLFASMLSIIRRIGGNGRDGVEACD